ncbi:MAG: extracellular solute-binding protein [Chloroflexota bacterium]
MTLIFIQRLARQLALLLVLSLFITACGTAPTASDPSAADAPSVEDEAAPEQPQSDTTTNDDTTNEQSDTNAAISDDIITVTTTNAPNENNPADIARHEQLLETFAEVQPDVTIDARQGGFDRETFTAKLAAGTMEDTFLVAFTEPQTLIKENYVADITDLAQEWEHFESFNPDVLEIVRDTEDRIYGIPSGGYALGLIYNRKLFEQAGLAPDAPPTSWEQVREYAQQLSDPSIGQAGFAELSKGNQGGWHFTAWVYSFGGDLMEQQDDGQWVATFNNEASVQALETLKAMRWEDQSMTEQQLLEVKDVLPLLATERVAMAIMAPDALPSLQSQYEANIEDFGFGPLPQQGGNATLAGGAAWMFNPSSPPEIQEAAFEWTVFRDFNIDSYEADLQGQAERGELVGWPQLPLFRGAYQEQREEVLARYANAPTEYYQPYLEADVALRPEPPIETQKLYAILDTAMQAVLTDENADPQQVLDEATQQFQMQVLDQLPAAEE